MSDSPAHQSARWAPLLAILLTACATSPPEKSRERSVAPGSMAVFEEQQGRHLEAAELWLQAADNAQGREQSVFVLRAVGALESAGEPQQAWALLDRIEEGLLSAEDLSLLSLSRAENALFNGNFEAANRALDAARGALPAGQISRFSAIQDSLIRINADPVKQLVGEVAINLNVLDPKDPVAISQFLKKFEHVPLSILQTAAETTGTTSLSGAWIRFIIAIRQGLVSVSGIHEAARVWANSESDHPVSRENFLLSAEHYRAEFRSPGQVAVLLPTQTPYGRAIVDGLLSAYLDDPGEISLRIYNSGESEFDALARYREAIGQGAEWIIGPIRRPSVETVLAAREPGLPLLLLNTSEPYQEREGQSEVFQLSLTQEDEARAVAEKMLERGHERAITLASNNRTGLRTQRAFTEFFESGGGQVIDSATFETSKNDHSEEMTQLLRIDESRNRKDALQSLLGLSLSFEFRLRRDFDAFFLSTTPEQARQIRPQLKFFEAGRVPIFAMGRVYDGLNRQVADRDLDGIILPASNAQIEISQGGVLPDIVSIQKGRWLNFFALGQDAWALVSRVGLLELDRDLSFDGATGSLSVGPGGAIIRSPGWVKFSRGKLTPVTWPTDTE